MQATAGNSWIEGVHMKLQYKFILIIGTVLTLTYLTILHYTSGLQNDLVIGQAQHQARMLHQQLILTREWVSDHHGLFVIKTDTVRENPFLDYPNVETSDGVTLVKRNPAMVTRELSEYADKAGFGWFRVTSLKPVNPQNTPDDFEKGSLIRFEKENLTEHMEIRKSHGSKVLRYIAPLLVKESCLPCHARHGYTIGDIRGALSITVPIDWADKVIQRNNRTIITYGSLSILFIAGVLFLLFNVLVANRLSRLKTAMDNYPASQYLIDPLPAGNDEIGHLAQGFSSLCERLEASKAELRQAAEQASYNEKMAALGQITAGIAHEVNNPLGGLRNCVKNMKDSPDDLELHARYLPLLDKGLQRIEQTMRQLLNFGRDNPLLLRKVDVDEEIRECFALLAYKMNRIELTLELMIGGAYCIDTEAIKQIVVNIGLNGIQAMGDCGVMNVRSWKEENNLRITISDSGNGIPHEIIDKIYDPFFTTKQVGEGTGLGLAVTYSLVHKMGGSIQVESTPGQGTTFTVTLPIEQCCEANRHQDNSFIHIKKGTQP
jgi:signal transduction histidine kinase